MPYITGRDGPRGSACGLTWAQRSSHVVKVRAASSVRDLYVAWHLEADANHAAAGAVVTQARLLACPSQGEESTAFPKEPGQRT